MQERHPFVNTQIHNTLVQNIPYQRKEETQKPKKERLKSWKL